MNIRYPKLVIDLPEKLFFTSDTHFGHANIITFCNRPFADVHEMNKRMTDNWNEMVPHDGLVIHTGDMAMGDPHIYRQHLNGEIILVLGNHDKIRFYKEFRAIHACLILDVKDWKHIKGHSICANHYPMLSWPGKFHVHGHHHEQVTAYHSHRYNIGVDTNNFAPISYLELMRKFSLHQIALHEHERMLQELQK